METLHFTPLSSVPVTDYRRVFRRINLPLAIVRHERGGARLVDATDAFIATLALPASVIGASIAEAFGGAEVFGLAAAIRAALASGEVQRLRSPAAGYAVKISPLGLRGARQALLALEDLPPNRRISRSRSVMFDQLGALGAGMFYVMNAYTGRVSHMDRRFAEMLGIDRNAATAGMLIACMHPQDRPRLDAHCDNIQRIPEGIAAEVVLRMRTACGAWAWIRLRERPLSRGGNGEVRRILGVATDVTEQEEMSRALADVSAALATAEETERRRIGRELHDSTAQHLLAIDLSLSALERRGVPAASRQSAADIRQSLDAARREIRTISYMLHPPGLQERGLAATLRSFCDGFGRRAGLSIALDLRLDAERPRYALELALFRVAQEALMNVHQHSGAHTAAVTLYRKEDAIVLEVQDDGVGLRNTALARALNAGGVGINGMRARLAQLGGSLSLVSDGDGLRLTARAPLRRGA